MTIANNIHTQKFLADLGAKLNRILYGTQVTVGKNPDFVVYFNPVEQYYLVYYKNRQLVEPKYKFAEVQSYLN